MDTIQTRAVGLNWPTATSNSREVTAKPEQRAQQSYVKTADAGWLRVNLGTRSKPAARAIGRARFGVIVPTNIAISS